MPASPVGLTGNNGGGLVSKVTEATVWTIGVVMDKEARDMAMKAQVRTSVPIRFLKLNRRALDLGSAAVGG